MNTPLANPTGEPVASDSLHSGSSWKKKLIVVLVVILACCGFTAAATAWWVKRNFNASPLRPASLTQAEQKVFDEKVGTLSAAADTPKDDGKTPEQRAAEAKRTLILTDKEINAFLAKQGIGERVKVNMRDGGIEATALVPVEKDFPLLGGTTVRLTLALSGAMGADQRPAFALTDLSVGGIPVPNAWLGYVKGVNLLAADVENDPAVKHFLAGIREFEIESGSIRVVLSE